MKSLLWEDSISGTPCLSSVPQLHEIMNWSKNKGLIRLADICMWDYDGNWSGWNFPDLPVLFNSHKSVLISHLTGLAPVHIKTVGDGVQMVFTLLLMCSSLFF